jgi:hypothetical protein
MKLSIRCKNSFHCCRCFQPDNNQKHFIFIEHTPFCRSAKCDIPCIAHKMKKQPIMSITSVQKIIDNIVDSKYNIVLYGLGSSDFPYQELILQKSNLFQTTVNNSYCYYSEHKSPNLLLFARAYDIYDMKEIINCGNYNGAKTIICNKVNDYEYIAMAKMAEKNNFSLVFDYDHISKNMSKLEKILQKLGDCHNVTYRGRCNGTKPIVIMNWFNSEVTYREEYHYFDTVKTVNKNKFLKIILN